MPHPLHSKSVWVFDLDNTLYDARSVLFEHVGARMTDYVARALNISAHDAFVLQKQYLDDYGATLSGLMDRHGLDPLPFLDYVHDVDLSDVAPDPDLGALIAALPGRKLIFTNGSRGHAARVTEKLGIADAFDAHFSIEDAGFTPKPSRTAFERLLQRHGFASDHAVMFEDMARNLAPAHDMGFATVLVGETDEDQPHVHYVTADLKQFLTDLRND